MALTVVSYNIYRGASGRLPALYQSMAQISPDIVGILEATAWGEDDARLIQEFASRVESPHYFFAKANTKYDMALFSRFPFTASSFTEKFWHTVVIATFSTREVGNIAVAMVHLNPKQEDERVEEVKHVCNLLTPYEHSIVMGDFNALSPHDPYDRERLRTNLNKSGVTKFGTDDLAFDTITLMEARGFKDARMIAAAPFIPTVPTPVNQDVDHAAELRLDYLFLTPSLSPYLKGIQVVRNPQTDTASDHYPIVAEFDLNLA